MPGTGLYLYNLKINDPQQRVGLAESFLNKFNIKVKKCTYFYESPPDRDGETVQRKTLSWDAFIKTDIHFSPYGFNLEGHSDALRGSVYFSLSTNEEPKRSYVNFQTESPLDTIYTEITPILATVLERATPSYGFFHHTPSIMSGNAYAIGVNGSAALKNDMPLWFQSDFNRADETPDYSGKKLRMVYPFNILNQTHLNIPFGSGTLQDFISETSAAGEISQIGDAYFLWSVPEDNIDNLNNILGDRDVLISWKDLSKKAPRRRLP